MPTSYAQSPRILICRFSAIGDVILTMPLLPALREHFPNAFLAWIVNKDPGKLLPGHEALDELIRVPRRWLRSPHTVWKVRRRLRAMWFDVAIDAQGLSKSAIAAWLSGAKRRIGFGCDLGREVSTWFNTELVHSDSEHIVDCHLDLLRPLGIQAPTVRFAIPETQQDAQTAARILHRAGIDGDFVIINPGAGWPSKRWPADRYAEVARHLGQVRGFPTLVLWAGHQEKAWAEQIVAGSGGHGRLPPPTTLAESAALSRRARMFLGSDTGPLHIAAAGGTPCVSLHGPTLAAHSGPYGAGHICLQQASLNGRFDPRRKTVSNELMRSIGVDLVCQACDRLLLAPGDRSAA
jgi:lipopolysaccharide heptosyltransferase I